MSHGAALYNTHKLLYVRAACHAGANICYNHCHIHYSIKQTYKYTYIIIYIHTIFT